MEQLIQYKPFHYYSFELKEEEVAVYIKTIKREIAYELDYVDLGLKIYRQSNRVITLWQWLLMVLFIASCIVSIMVPTVLLISASVVLMIGCLVLSISKEPPLIYLVGGEQKISFLADTGNVRETEAFIEELQQRVRIAYRELYLDGQDGVPESEQRSRIKWLHEMKVIDKTEKKYLLAHLKEAFHLGIGFS